ncbi:hypothetical protein NQ317_000485 [Molorchus minor]|uniref:THAP-type domain-containing protein n=1 Tax=Molorchus minor TaxID=1323400 RepID=A0ABQ9JJG0_9CUCU|nr:hypothetical protein NQ317_000485 [Molorchus minor]
MPCCCVPNCSERTEKGIRLFLLPQGKRNIERRKKWIVNIKRKNKLPERAYVCEKHFTEDQFENKRQDLKRPLRWNAVPTLFLHKKNANDNENNNFVDEEFAVEPPNINEASISNNINPEINPQKRMEGFKFGSGILEHVFTILRTKVECMKLEEREAVLLVDEMAIKPGLEYDTALEKVVGRPTMLKSDGSNKENIATHALVFMLGGLTTRWKQTIAYEYTGTSYCAKEANQLIKNIICKCHHIGLNISVVISDMGPQNQAVWRLNGVVCSRHEITKNFAKHPSDNDRKLYFMPDSPHVFKNMRLALTEGQNFYLSPDIVKRYSLPSNEVSLDPVKFVYAQDNQSELKVAPRLKHNVLKPGHYDKMNVGLALALVNRDVAAAINFYIAQNKLDRKHYTTAWFFEIMEKWFCIMNSRSRKLALSQNQNEIYIKTTTFLKDVIYIIQNMNVGKTNRWKPFQTGIVLATQTALDVQEHYLNEQNFHFIMLGRLTQDALENLFSMVRSRNPVPDAKEFKCALRLIAISQFFSPLNTEIME